MRRREFGATGLEVSVLGQGTWRMEKDPVANAVEALRQGLELGMTHIDTAEAYGDGQVEELVASALVGRRDRAFLTSKVLPQNATHDGTLRACEASLKRLKTDRLDLYLLHWAGSYPLEGTLRAFDKLQRDGKIRAYGVSNFDVAELEQALAIVGEGKLACNQALYHLGERTVESQILPWCQAHRVALVGYSPFGSGHFPDPAVGGGKVLAQLAKAKGCTPRQMALAFLTRQSGTFSLPKASNAAHAEENAKADALTLTDEEVTLIDQAF